MEWDQWQSRVFVWSLPPLSATIAASSAAFFLCTASHFPPSPLSNPTSTPALPPGLREMDISLESLNNACLFQTISSPLISRSPLSIRALLFYDQLMVFKLGV